MSGLYCGGLPPDRGVDATIGLPPNVLRKPDVRIDLARSSSSTVDIVWGLLIAIWRREWREECISTALDKPGRLGTGLVTTEVEVARGRVALLADTDRSGGVDEPS